MKRAHYNIEAIKKFMEFRADVNCGELSEIDFYENGKKVEIDPELVKEFAFTGLCNIDFIASGFYKDGFNKEKS